MFKIRHDKSKMRSRSLIVAAIALVIFAYSVQTSLVQAWAWPTHRFIVNEAKDVFSDGSFFSVHYSTIYTYCTKPDEWKGSDPYEGYRHWYHIDEPDGENEYYRGGLPNNWSLLDKGVLPWAVEDNFAMLVQSLESQDWEHAAQLMGVIAHYTGDATMPLHATSDYNPGYNHVNYEHEVDDHLYEISIPNYVPQELENLFESTMAVLEESYGFTGYTEDKLSYWLAQDVLWNDTIYHITENRLRSSTQFTANLWYTAMIHAGLTIQAPTLLEPGNGANTRDNTPTFEWSSTVAGYQLEYATDNTFTTNVTIVKDLTPTSYTPATPLADGTWYWRVRSGDNTTSVGLWSNTWLFTITREIDVSISPSYQGGLPGDNLFYTLTVADKGNFSDNYDLSVSDNSGWQVSLYENLISVPAGENRTTTLRVKIPDNAALGTMDNIIVIATSQWDNMVSDSDSCIAHAASWTGTVTLELENLYSVRLEEDLWIYIGSKLVVKFYDYADAFENENVFWDSTTPAHLEGNESVSHPENVSAKKVRLDLTTDDTDDVISTISSFTVTRGVLNGRLVEIYLEWPFASPELRSIQMAEIVDLYLQWPFAPF